jgi:RNA polymerase sigma factor (sigma-70 family)
MNQRRSYRGHGGPPDVLPRREPVSEQRALELVKLLPSSDQRTESDPATRELVEGLAQDAYEIAMKFSHKWYEDASDCCGVAQLAMVEAVRSIDPAAVKHGRGVFSFMQRCVENALLDYIKKEHKFCNGKPTRKVLTGLDWIGSDPNPDAIRRQASCDPSRQMQTCEEHANAQLLQLTANRSLQEIISDILECCTEQERPIAERLIHAFHEHGDNIAAVARELRLDRKTVRNLRAALKERYYNSPRQRILRILSEE